MQNKNLLNDTQRIVTSRLAVPTTATPDVPYQVRITSPAEILKSIRVFAIPATAGTIPNKTGWKIVSGGTQTIPAAGSNDDSNYSGLASGWIPAMNLVSLDDVNQIVQGPPHELTIQVYNADAIVWHYFFILTFAPKIELPLAPVSEDEKK